MLSSLSHTLMEYIDIFLDMKKAELNYMKQIIKRYKKIGSKNKGN
jgi:hypothetical protein